MVKSRLNLSSHVLYHKIVELQNKNKYVEHSIIPVVSRRCLCNAQKAKYIMKAVFPFVVLSACGPSSPSFGPALGDDFHIFKIFTFEVN